MKIRMTKKMQKLLLRKEKGEDAPILKDENDDDSEDEKILEIIEERKKPKNDQPTEKKEKKEVKVVDQSELKARDKVLEEIKELEKKISNTKYNKKTQNAIGIYKAQLAKLKAKLTAKSSSGPKQEGFSVKKSGDASAILIGFPSVGKSTLLNILTNANSAVAAYEFTTLSVIPGLLEYNHAKIQVLDVPGIVEGAAKGTGKGKEVLSVVQNADLVIFVVDATRPQHFEVIKKEIYDANIRINEEKPDVTLKKCERGGIDFGTTVKLTHIDEETIKDILREFKFSNAQIIIRSNITPDQLIDVIEKNKIYIPAITILNKIDMVDSTILEQLKKKIKPDLCISANQKKSVEDIKAAIFNKLNFMRIYLKEVNKKPDMEVPMIVKVGYSIQDICNKLHRDFVAKFKFARVWGKSAKFDGQILHLNHVLKDEDILEIHMI